MGAISDVIGEIFPLVRGRTGTESLQPAIPIVIRVYSGSFKIATHRAKVRSSVDRLSARIGTKPVKFKYRATFMKMTHVSYALDYPLLDRVETFVECQVKLGLSGTITLVPAAGHFLTISGETQYP